MNTHDLIYLVGKHNFVQKYNEQDGIQIRVEVREKNDLNAEDILSDILFVLEPDISFLRFRQLTKLINSVDENYLFDPYDTEYKIHNVQTIDLDDLYKAFIKNGINPGIKAEGFKIEDLRPMVEKSVFFTEKDGCFFYELKNIDNKKIREETNEWISNINKTLNNGKGKWHVSDFFTLLNECCDFNKKITIEEIYVLYMNSINATYPTITTEKTK